MITGLDEARLTEPAMANGWSVKDVLAHITAWEAELIRALVQIAGGQKPRLSAGPDYDKMNAEIYAEQKDRPLDLVLGDFRTILPQILRRLEPFTDGDLNNQNRYPWRKGRPLLNLVAETTYIHYGEHYPDLAALRDRVTE